MSICLLNEGEKIISDALVKETEDFLLSQEREAWNAKKRGQEKMETSTHDNKPQVSQDALPEKMSPHIPNLPSNNPMEAFSSHSVMVDQNKKTNRRNEELLDFDIINTARRHGLSKAALFVYDTIKSPPTVDSNFCLIKGFQYLDYFHFDTFRYGLKELQLMGYIYSYREGWDSYLLYFTRLGIDAFSNRYLLETRTCNKPVILDVEGRYDKTKLNSAVLYLMRECSCLEEKLPSLIKAGYVEIQDNFLCWKKSKQSLAQFFGDVLSYTRWSDIEKAFRTSRLKGSYHHATSNSQEINNLKKICRLE